MGKTMQPDDLRRRQSGYGRAMLVTIGWYATIIATVVVGATSMPEERSANCTAMSSCLSTAEVLQLVGVLYALPAFLGALFFAALALWALRRVLRSPPLTGTLAAALGMAGVAAAIALYTAGHR